MNYRDAILEVIRKEGGDKITNIAADRGGLTKYGISQAAYPSLDIANLTLDQAIEIYKRDYWDKIKGDQIRNYALAFSIFDQAVNRGVSTAVKQAQRILGITADGVAGNQFLTAINSVNPMSFLNSFLAASEEAYRAIASKPGQDIFLRGWLNRVEEIRKYASNNIGVVAGGGVALVVIGVIIFILMSSGKKMAVA